jgi:hypothetical protein
MNWITCWAPAKQRSSDLDGTVVCCCCLGLANLGRNEAQITHVDMGVPSFGHWTHWTYKSNKKWMVQWLNPTILEVRVLGRYAVHLLHSETTT